MTLIFERHAKWQKKPPHPPRRLTMKFMNNRKCFIDSMFFMALFKSIHWSWNLPQCICIRATRLFWIFWFIKVMLNSISFIFFLTNPTQYTPGRQRMVTTPPGFRNDLCTDHMYPDEFCCTTRVSDTDTNSLSIQKFKKLKFCTL